MGSGGARGAKATLQMLRQAAIDPENLPRNIPDAGAGQPYGDRSQIFGAERLRHGLAQATTRAGDHRDLAIEA